MSFNSYGALALFARDDEAGQNDTNYCLIIETLEMVIHLHTRYDGKIEPGYIARAYAELYACLEPSYKQKARAL